MHSRTGAGILPQLVSDIPTDNILMFMFLYFVFLMCYVFHEGHSSSYANREIKSPDGATVIITNALGVLTHR